MHINRLAADLGEQVESGHRLADHAVLSLGLGGRGQIQIQHHGLPSQQAGVRQAAAIAGAQLAVLCTDLSDVHTPALSRLGHQPGSGLRRGHPQRLGVGLQGTAGNRRPLVGRAGGVAQDHPHLGQRQIEFFGHDLGIGGGQPGAQIHMAGQRHGDAVIAQRQQQFGALGRVARHLRRLAG